jgi:hypothetical protein
MLLRLVVEGELGPVGMDGEEADALVGWLQPVPHLHQAVVPPFERDARRREVHDQRRALGRIEGIVPEVDDLDELRDRNVGRLGRFFGLDLLDRLGRLLACPVEMVEAGGDDVVVDDRDLGLGDRRNAAQHLGHLLHGDLLPEVLEVCHEQSDVAAQAKAHRAGGAPGDQLELGG